MNQTLALRLEDPKSTRAVLQGYFTEMQSSYTDLVKLAPPALQDPLLKLKTRADEFLASLAGTPTDQVPAAQEAAWQLRCMASACVNMQDQYQGLMTALKGMQERFNPVQTELQGLQTKVEKGELLTVEQVNQKVTAAVEAALKAAKARAELLQARRTELQSVKLPVPADTVIDLEKDEQFATLKKEGESRLKQLSEAGFKELTETELQGLLYGSKENFDSTLNLARKMAGKGDGANNHNNPGGKEPLAGGTGGDQKPKKMAIV